MESPEAVRPGSWPDLDWYAETRLSPGVHSGDLVFVSGCSGANRYPNDSKAQIRLAYQYVADVLEAAGATWDDVVSITTYHVDMRRYIDDVLAIHREFVRNEPYPTWTALGVTELYEPEAIFEVSVIARKLRPGFRS
jgi:enamine deaminase RidA (YjgF/YER057c/UK114 family)